MLGSEHTNTHTHTHAHEMIIHERSLQVMGRKELVTKSVTKSGLSEKNIHLV